MPTVNLTADQFDGFVEAGVVLVDWWAGWCGPCRMFAPIFEAAAERHPDVLFGKVDTETEATLADELGIRSIPTLMVFRDGLLLFSRPGVLPPAALDELIAAVKKLDMDSLRRRLSTAARDLQEAR